MITFNEFYQGHKERIEKITCYTGFAEREYGSKDERDRFMKSEWARVEPMIDSIYKCLSKMLDIPNKVAKVIINMPKDERKKADINSILKLL